MGEYILLFFQKRYYSIRFRRVNTFVIHIFMSGTLLSQNNLLDCACRMCSYQTKDTDLLAVHLWQNANRSPFLTVMRNFRTTYTLKNVRIKVKCISVIVQSTHVHTHHTLHAVK